MATTGTKAFQNSMAFQRRIFDFDPKEKVNLLLVDFSDSGNASAGSVPYDGMTFYLAPPSYGPDAGNVFAQPANLGQALGLAHLQPELQLKELIGQVPQLVTQFIT